MTRGDIDDLVYFAGSERWYARYAYPSATRSAQINTSNMVRWGTWEQTADTITFKTTTGNVSAVRGFKLVDDVMCDPLFTH
jgi:hypothetical protein